MASLEWGGGNLLVFYYFCDLKFELIMEVGFDWRALIRVGVFVFVMYIIFKFL
jgi:hypothetical protein